MRSDDTLLSVADLLLGIPLSGVMAAAQTDRMFISMTARAPGIMSQFRRGICLIVTRQLPSSKAPTKPAMHR